MHSNDTKLVCTAQVALHVLLTAWRACAAVDCADEQGESNRLLHEEGGNASEAATSSAEGGYADLTPEAVIVPGKYQ